MAASNEILRFLVTLNFRVASPTYSITDLIGDDYTDYGETPANAKGILKITDPQGQVIYQNTGWATDSFASPDILQSGGWESTTHLLPVDSDDVVLTGEYTFYYKISFDNGSTVYQTSREYDYAGHDITDIGVDLQLSVSCRTAELTSDDATDYTLPVGDSDFIPVTTTRSHSIYKPKKAGCTIPATVTTSDKKRIIGGGATSATTIWTGTWTAAISTELEYDLSYWGELVFVKLLEETSDTQALEVSCDDCLCDSRECIEQLVDKWKAAMTTNKSLADTLQTKIIRLGAAMNLYTLLQSCGEDVDSVCDEISDILLSEGCTGCGDTSANPTPVYAWGSSIQITGGVSTFAFTVSANVPTGGNNGDLHIQTTGWILWGKVAGEWVSYGSFKGADGSSASAKYSLKHNSISDVQSAAGTSEQDLKSYLLPGGTLSSDTSYLVIRAIFELSTAQKQKTVKLYWGATEILNLDTLSYAEPDADMVEMEMRVYRTGASAQFITGYVRQLGSPGSTSGPFVATAALSLASDITIKATATIPITPVLGDVTQKQLLVEHFIA